MSAMVGKIEAVDRSTVDVIMGGSEPMLCTSRVTAAMIAARQLAPNGEAFGKGGTVRYLTGIYRDGAHGNWSRWVGIKGAGGARGGTVISSDYSELNGVAGEDAHFDMANDGTHAQGIGDHMKIEGFTLDGNKGQEPTGHIRHGMRWRHVETEDVGGTDTIATMKDILIRSFPGNGLDIYRNDGGRGSNINIGTCKGYGWRAERSSDSKWRAIGLGGHEQGAFLWINLASWNVAQLDAWTSKDFEGTYLGQLISCKNFHTGPGQLEGMTLVRGNNNDKNSDTFRWDMGIVFDAICWKVSVDMKAAIGTRYDCHLHVQDGFGIKIPSCTFGCGKVDADGNLDPAVAAARPPVAIKIDTQVPNTDKNYQSYYKNAGLVDCAGAEFIAIRGSDDEQLPSPTHVAFTKHISNRPDCLINIPYGEIRPRIIGKQGPGEYLADGTMKSKARFPLGYLYTEPGGAWTRLLTDTVEQFAVPDWTAVYCPAGWAWYVVLE